MNLRPSGYEPDELPGCSTPRYMIGLPLQPGFFLFCRSSKALPSAVRLWLLHQSDASAFFVCYPGYCTEAKRPLEGGLLFRLGRRMKRRCFIDHVSLPLAFRRAAHDLVCFLVLSRPGSDLLSRVLRRSTIGAGAFHGRVRNGNGCSHPAITTRSTKGKNCAGDSAKPNEKLDFFERIGSSE